MNENLNWTSDMKQGFWLDYVTWGRWAGWSAASTPVWPSQSGLRVGACWWGSRAWGAHSGGKSCRRSSCAHSSRSSSASRLCPSLRTLHPGACDWSHWKMRGTAVASVIRCSARGKMLELHNIKDNWQCLLHGWPLWLITGTATCAQGF